jgi:hypothetical protein
MEKLIQETPSKDVLMKAAHKKGVDMAAASQISECTKRNQIGQRVSLQGLSYYELNDASGVVVDWERGGRVTVKLTHASSKMLQKHSDGLSVKWENIEWMDKKPISSKTIHCTMNAEDNTGRTLNPAKSQEKLRNLQRALVRANKESGSIIRLCIEDDKTHTDHMNQSDAREFLQQQIGKLRNNQMLFAGNNQLYL